MTHGAKSSAPPRLSASAEADPALIRALKAAVTEHRAGRLGKAKAMYQEIRRRYPESAGALHLLGTIAVEEGQPDLAIEMMVQAIEENTTIPYFHGNLGEIYRKVGRIEDAIACCRHALEIDPMYPEALNTLGAALHANGDLEEAEITLRRAIEFKPDFAPAHANLGNVLRTRGEPEKAIRAYGRALRRDPRLVGAYLALGGVLQAQGQVEEAVETYRRALEIAPKDAKIRSNLGVALQALDRAEEAVKYFREAAGLEPNLAEGHLNLAKALRSRAELSEAASCLDRALALNPALAEAHFEMGRVLADQEAWDQAEGSYREAVALKPDFNEAQRALGTTVLRQGKHLEAEAAFRRLLEIERGLGCATPDELIDGRRATRGTATGPPRTTRFALLDRAEQIEHLIGKGVLDSSFALLATRYRSVMDELADQGALQKRIALTPEQRQRIEGFYDQVIHYAPAPACAAGAINDSLDFESLEENYLAEKAPVVYFDGFLSQEALGRLRKFCLESTIYFSLDPARFVASSLADGFNCGLLYQIVEELKEHFPRVLGPEPLSEMWAYRHDAGGRGVHAHADHAAVTVNFWITPDKANLAPERGGLVVYKKEHPLDWNWEEHNTAKYEPVIHERIERLLESAESVTIPYRENRAVMFASNLFHSSGELRFADGFENRRTNVTLLFGRWGAPD